MALTESTMLQLGSALPNFALTNVVDDAQVSDKDFADQPLLVMFICNHCPYVIHLAEKLAEATTGYLAQGVGVVAISSNDVSEYPADSPEKMKEEVSCLLYTSPSPRDLSTSRMPSSA